MTNSTPDNNSPSEACERFAAILDAIFVEEKQPTADERVFLDEHKGDCPSCGRLADALEELGTPAPVQIDAVKKATDSYFKQKQGQQRNIKRFYPLVAAAAVLFFGLAAVIFLQKGEPEQDHLQVKIAQGALLIDDDTLATEGKLIWHRGSRLVAKERTQLNQSDELTIDLEPNSQIALSLHEGKKTRLHLIAGEASFELNPGAGRSLVIETVAADVVVTGTVFRVKILSDDIRVQVTRGSVRVESKIASVTPIDVKAGQFVLLSRGEVTEASDEKIAASLGPDEPNSADEERIAQEPATDQPSLESILPTPHLGEKDGQLQRHQHRSSLSLGELIRHARQCRTAGRWACAAQQYKSVAKHFPNSPERLTVLVPLAEIELDKLGQPMAALRHYQEYLKHQPHGALAPEAYFGKCRAYEGLSRNEQEDRCLRAFLQKFPKSIHARRAKTRLVAISDSKK